MSAHTPDFIAEAITEAYGERCPDVSEHCPCCQAWSQYDNVFGAIKALIEWDRRRGYPTPYAVRNPLFAALTKAQGLSPEREEAARPQRKKTDHASKSPGPINCSIRKRFQGEAYPKTCELCRLGPCPFFHGDGPSKAVTEGAGK